MSETSNSNFPEENRLDLEKSENNEVKPSGPKTSRRSFLVGAASVVAATLLGGSAGKRVLDAGENTGKLELDTRVTEITEMIDADLDRAVEIVREYNLTEWLNSLLQDGYGFAILSEKLFGVDEVLDMGVVIFPLTNEEKASLSFDGGEFNKENLGQIAHLLTNASHTNNSERIIASGRDFEETDSARELDPSLTPNEFWFTYQPDVVLTIDNGEYGTTRVSYPQQPYFGPNIGELKAQQEFEYYPPLAVQARLAEKYSEASAVARNPVTFRLPATFKGTIVDLSNIRQLQDTYQGSLPKFLPPLNYFPKGPAKRKDESF